MRISTFLVIKIRWIQNSGQFRTLFCYLEKDWQDKKIIYVHFLSDLKIVKFRYYEKATKFEKIFHLFWQNSCFYSVASKQVGDFFKFLWPFQKSWTLHTLVWIPDQKFKSWMVSNVLISLSKPRANIHSSAVVSRLILICLKNTCKQLH